MAKPTRYFIAQDDDGHWYLIPLMYKEAWCKWRDIPSDDERSWEVPFYATIISGPHLLTFTDPK